MEPIFKSAFNEIRASGVLMHITSLPSKYGIGTLGDEAFKFVDFLKGAGQKYWQVLPIGQTGYGESPYQSFSSYAGNPYMIDLDCLCKDGLLSESFLQTIDFGTNDSYIDFDKIKEHRWEVLRIAFQNFDRENNKEFAKFCDENSWWLDDYVLFSALKLHFKDDVWMKFPLDVRVRKNCAINLFRTLLNNDIEFFKFVQFEFFKQWFSLKKYANNSGIYIIGDIPIYVALDSADVWSNPSVFKLDDSFTPTVVAGCPPDYFSELGQLWGNPIYDWSYLEKTGYKWWIDRIQYNTQIFDVIRIDHFRAFDSYYEIPFGALDAVNGQWCDGPGEGFFLAVKQKLGDVDIIAEDLGFVTDRVRGLIKSTGVPGMKILQFAFDLSGKSEYLPHNIPKNSVVYTGTHDNDTVLGWAESTNLNVLNFAKRYAGEYCSEPMNWSMIRLAYMSAGALAIIQMQDFLGLSSDARMNIPSTIGDNWKWRMSHDAISYGLMRKIRNITKIYGRLENDSDMSQNFTFEDLKVTAENEYCKEVSDLNVHELHNILGKVVMGSLSNQWAETKLRHEKQKQACYFSAEFLMGRMVYNNLYALGILDTVKKIFNQANLDIAIFEDIEDAALGNGGLGRLAACFLDSAATHDIPLNGYGIRYKYGLFKQVIKNGFQKEYADNWEYFGDPWSVRRDEDTVNVVFEDQVVRAVPYDMPIIGYKNGVINTLRLWQSEPMNEFNFEKFNNQMYSEAVKEKNIAEDISRVLYPNDSTIVGKKLRLKQQYFFVSASLQDLLKNYERVNGSNYNDFPNKFVIQLNDTHPVIAIPELVRLLMIKGLSFDEAFSVAKQTFAYTNHTVMSEALEKWDISMMKSLIPDVYDVIVKINDLLVDELTVKGFDVPKFLSNTKSDESKLDSMKIIYAGKVHMANLAVFGSKCTNGVAKIHTQILKEDVLKDWFAAYPTRFRNITNGITQRRWLGLSNPELSDLITKHIGDKWITDLSELKKLSAFKNNQDVIEDFNQVKQIKKHQLSDYIYKTDGIRINPNFIFDVQIKRLHEYKRQFMNALSIMYLYFGIKDGSIKDFYPTTFIFGAKAAPGYKRAKAIIKYINEIANVINNDLEVNDRLQVVFVSNYNCSYAEKIIPAADVSEQISTAGTEASGTGNMKLMLNGAVTLGTYDGANIEIVEQAGFENNYIFGARVEDIATLKKSYDPKKIYSRNKNIRRVVDTLVSGLCDDGGDGSFRSLYESLIKGSDTECADAYYLLQDLEPYVETKLLVNKDYKNTTLFRRKCFENIINSGFFSSDRTVSEYVWDL